MKRILFAMSALAVSLGLLAACAPAVTEEEVTVEAFEMAFNPEEVTIPADTAVAFTLGNTGAAFHTFTIDELGIHVALEPGATETVVINAPPGMYTYYCAVPGHREAGMVGRLVVE